MAPTPSTRIQSLKARSVFRTNRRRKFAVGAAMLSLLLIASSAAAEPFAITSGAFTFVFNSSSFVEVGGPQFLVTNGDTNPEEFGLPGLALEHANPFATTLPVSGRIQVNLSARLLLTGHPEPEFGSSVLFDLMFNGPAAVAHQTDAACEGCLVIAGTSPFRVTGVLTAQGFDDPPGIFRRDVAGSGTATVGFFREFGTDTLRPFANFEFAPTAPTPEPASLMLLAAGIVWVGRRRLRTID